MNSSISSFRKREEPHRKNPSKLSRSFARAAFFVMFLAVIDLMIGSVLDMGLRRYFGMDGKVDVLCVGHSRTVLGIDAEMLSRETGLRVAKYAVNGANIADRDAMIRQFLTEHPEVRLIIYDVEASTFSDDGLSSNSYRLFFPFLDNPEMGAYLNKQGLARSDFWLKKIVRTARYDETTFSLAMRGLLGMNRNLKHGRFDEARARRWIEQGKSRSVKIDSKSYKAFLATVDFVHSRGVTMLLVDMPTVDLLNQAERPASEAVRAMFGKFEEQYTNLDYYDLSTAYESDYGIFYDMIHLNAEGQKIVTSVLTQEVKKRILKIQA